MTQRFVYTIDGHTYFLVPEYNITATGRVWVVSAEMYNQDNELVGTWMRYNMPYPLILSLNKYVKERLVRQVVLTDRSKTTTFAKGKKRRI